MRRSHRDFCREDRVRRAILEAVLEAKSAGVPAVLATQLRTGEHWRTGKSGISPWAVPA